MMCSKAITIAAVTLAMLAGSCCCDDNLLPDLAWNKIDFVYNPCTYSIELLNTENLYQLKNPDYPSSSQVEYFLLYWRKYENGFFDCIGRRWIPTPPFELESVRFVKNRKSIFRRCSTGAVSNIVAQAEITIRSPGGDVNTMAGPIVEFGTIDEGESAELITIISADHDGLYSLNYVIDPENMITEKDESNNDYSESFTRSSELSLEHFLVYTPTLYDLEGTLKPYVLFSNGEVIVMD